MDVCPINFDTCPINDSSLWAKKESCLTPGTLHVRVSKKAIDLFPEYSNLREKLSKLQKLKDCEIKRLLIEDKCVHSRFYLNHQKEDVFVKSATILYDVAENEAKFFNRLHNFTDKNGDLGNCDEEDIVKDFTIIFNDNEAADYRDFVLKKYDDADDQKRELFESIQEFKKYSSLKFKAIN
ncbi:hypothetical protein LCGC14_0606630 [marine sediment metagenome]|uniref:Uncharacterized protein n=1 Tax=marine sediment metagenome TaxID=412755 RepID=A0A0F9UHG0_9ZZZZ